MYKNTEFRECVAGDVGGRMSVYDVYDVYDVRGGREVDVS
jgi:hypothetical protein